MCGSFCRFAVCINIQNVYTANNKAKLPIQICVVEVYIVAHSDEECTAMLYEIIQNTTHIFFAI